MDVVVETKENTRCVVLQGENKSLVYENIVDYFEAIVAKYPNNIALSFESEKITYKELNNKINQLAHFIQERYINWFQTEIKPNSLIGLYLDRGLNMIVSMLAVLKSGAAYIPLDIQYPEKRLSSFFEKYSVDFVIANDMFAKQSSVISNQKTINLDHDFSNIQVQSHQNPGLRILPTHLAYVIFTSGSSGSPKGVMVSHVNVCNIIDWVIGYYPVSPKDCFIQIASFTFDLSVWEIFSALLSGGCLVLTRPYLYKDPNYLLDLMINNHVTILGTVPSMFKLLLNSPKIDALKSLKHVLSCAEPLTDELYSRISSTFLNTRIYNGYGPTETTVMCTHWLCPKYAKHSKISLGKPIQNTQMYVLDEKKDAVYPGEIGELYVSGAGITQGYLNQPELTDDCFSIKEFFPNQSTLCYKTGDLVRYDADGHIEFVGRSDEQVKLRGYRIELMEIERTLGIHPSIGDCVTVINEIDSERHLVAYFTIKNDEGPRKIDPQNLRHFLRQYLPEYMIPTYFVKLDKIPLNDNGKRDKKSLPIPDHQSRFSMI